MSVFSIVVSLVIEQLFTFLLSGHHQAYRVCCHSFLAKQKSVPHAATRKTRSLNTLIYFSTEKNTGIGNFLSFMPWCVREGEQLLWANVSNFSSLFDVTLPHFVLSWGFYNHITGFWSTEKGNWVSNCGKFTSPWRSEVLVLPLLSSSLSLLISINFVHENLKYIYQSVVSVIIWYLSAVSSHDTQGLLPKPGIEDSFHQMLLVRYRRCDLENLHLVKD